MSPRIFFKLLFITLLMTAPEIDAYSGMLSICEITESRMLAGMGGANNPGLQMSIVIDSIEASANKAVVSISSTNPDVLRNGIRGLLVWARDGNGTRVGSWSVRPNQQLITPICSGGAISHSGIGQKQINNQNSMASPNSLSLVLPNNTLSPISIRSVVVYTRRDWQFLDPVVAQGLGTNETGLDSASRNHADTYARGGNQEYLYMLLSSLFVSAVMILF